jgi:hypothetical protein
LHGQRHLPLRLDHITFALTLLRVIELRVAIVAIGPEKFSLLAFTSDDSSLASTRDLALSPRTSSSRS